MIIKRLNFLVKNILYDYLIMSHKNIRSDSAPAAIMPHKMFGKYLTVPLDSISNLNYHYSHRFNIGV